MRSLISLIVILALTTLAHGQGQNNIDLSTVPQRQTVQLTIYNAEDLTLVRETRFITFNQGVNALQFSWANTLIDPTSVELEFLTQPDQLTLLDTTFPHDKPQMLYWNVHSEFAGEAKVQISYFTSGITWSADYLAVAGPDEQQIGLEGFVTVTNNSGEDYEDAQVRLVVGTINLVEQIAELAKRGIVPDYDQLNEGRRREVRHQAMRKMFEAAEAPMADAAGFVEEKQILKQGLSEYFIFTIEGTETIPNRWSKRMRSFHADDVPIDVAYRYRPQEYGDQLVRLLLLVNDSESNLGESPLPDGTVRVFRRTGRDGLAFLTEQHIQYVPVGDKIELNLGQDREVVFELEPMRVFRNNIWAKLQGVDVLRRIDQPGVRIDPRSRIVGWDTHTVYTQAIRNYTDEPIDVQVRRSYDGDVRFVSGLDPVLHDYRTVQYTRTLQPGETAELRYEVVMAEGRNAEQSRVTLQAGDPAPVPWLR